MNTAHQQNGAALVVALIFLVVMTVAGITAMRFSNLEEKITGNVLIKNHNFQVAHSEIRAQLLDFNTSITALDNLQKAMNQATPTSAEKAADPTSNMLPATARKSLALTKKISNSTSTVASTVRYLQEAPCEGASTTKFTCFNFELNSTASTASGSQSWQSQGFKYTLSK